MYLKVLVAAIISLGFLAWMIYLNLFKRKTVRKENFDKFQKEYLSVVATPIKTSYRYGIPGDKRSTAREGAVTVIYEYTVDGKTYHKRFTFAERGDVIADYPANITIYYPPGDPSKGICKEQYLANTTPMGCLIGFIGFFVLFGVLLKLFGVT